MLTSNSDALVLGCRHFAGGRWFARAARLLLARAFSLPGRPATARRVALPFATAPCRASNIALSVWRYTTRMQDYQYNNPTAPLKRAHRTSWRPCTYSRVCPAWGQRLGGSHRPIIPRPSCPKGGNTTRIGPRAGGVICPQGDPGDLNLERLSQP